MKNELEAFTRGYRMSEHGSIINPSGHIISGSINSCGYVQFNIRRQGKILRCSAHRLQAYQKYGDDLYANGIEVRHKNSIRIDNSNINILIGTHSQNMLDKPKDVRLNAAKIATSFARKHDKNLIRLFYDETKSYKKTMLKFGISSKGTLHFIINK